MAVAQDRVGLAKSALARRDWTEALEIWNSVIEEQPQQVVGYLGKGQTLREMGRLDEAEAALADATERFPQNVWPLATHADIARRRRDWHEALRRYETVRDRFPHYPIGYLGAAQALEGLERLDEADELGAEAVERFPANDWAALAYSRLAMKRHDWGEAMRRWDLMLTRFPRDQRAVAGKAETLIRAGRLDESEEAALAAATKDFPDDASLAGGRDMLASHHVDAAERRWLHLFRRLRFQVRRQAAAEYQSCYRYISRLIRG
jgi:predicted Zn-dependent protease